jgi:hypothetical protein
MSTLADLRRQNIAEQKGEDSPTSPASTELRTSASTQASTEPSTDTSTEPLAETGAVATPDLPINTDTEMRKSASTQVRKEGSTSARERVSKQSGADVSKHALAIQVKDALDKKRNHIGGVKATVDMSPELSKRAKKYCLEHDVSSVRVLCLELLEAFLAEEGF